MPKIEEMWAWVSTDHDESDEGVIAANFEGTWLPLVGADKARVVSLKDLAKFTAMSTGKPVKLVRFSTREEIEVVLP